MTTWGKGIYERPDEPADWFTKASVEIDDEETRKSWRRDFGHYAMAGFRAGEARANRYKQALEDMVWQFAYSNDNGEYHTGGLSALEHAFDVLGWDDPHPMPKEILCDEPGCKRQSTSGFPTETGYRRTCGDHYIHTLRRTDRGKP